jgi:hypothetical protein
MADRISFKNKINDSVQVGDELYYTIINPATGEPAFPPPIPQYTTVGVITGIGEKHVLVADGDAPTLANNMFFIFKKPSTSSTNDDNVTINSYTKSGVKGSYASVVMSTTDPTSRAKLFTLGAEIAESSK